MEYQIPWSIGAHQLDCLLRSPAPVEDYRFVLELLNALNHLERYPNGCARCRRPGCCPVAAAVTLVDGQRVHMHVFPLQSNQLADSQPGHDADIDHRRVRLDHEVHECVELLGGDVGLDSLAVLGRHELNTGHRTPDEQPESHSTSQG